MMQMHRHIPTDFSCVHYLQFNKDQHKGLKIQNTNDFGEFTRLLLPNLYESTNNNDTESSYLYNTYEYTPEEDEMIIFSSLMPHSIPKQPKANKNRISIVSNIRIDECK